MKQGRMRKLSPLESSLLWLRLTTRSERIGIALGALLALAVLAALVAQGANVGAHIWRKGWACGETLKGGPTCLPDPR
jgi:hypothetical protein